jgi:Na+/phosphate symporter|tara:strand:- start:212 stop:412 length:201 start_codon:yes stop_codon:yes gene_type:complete
MEQLAVWLTTDEIIEITDSIQWIAEDTDKEVQENNKDLINAYHKLTKQLKDYHEARAEFINKSTTK